MIFQHFFGIFLVKSVYFVNFSNQRDANFADFLQKSKLLSINSNLAVVIIGLVT